MSAIRSPLNPSEMDLVSARDRLLFLWLRSRLSQHFSSNRTPPHLSSALPKSRRVSLSLLSTSAINNSHNHSSCQQVSQTSRASTHNCARIGSFKHTKRRLNLDKEAERTHARAHPTLNLMDPPLKSPASAQRDTSPSPPVPNRIRRNTACTSCRDSKVGFHFSSDTPFLYPYIPFIHTLDQFILYLSLVPLAWLFYLVVF